MTAAQCQAELCILAMSPLPVAAAYFPHRASPLPPVAALSDHLKQGLAVALVLGTSPLSSGPGRGQESGRLAVRTAAGAPESPVSLPHGAMPDLIPHTCGFSDPIFHHGHGGRALERGGQGATRAARPLSPAATGARVCAPSKKPGAPHGATKPTRCQVSLPRCR